MSPVPFTLKQLGAEIEAERFKVEVRAFQRQQRVQMRKAARIVQVDVIHEVQNLFHSTGGIRFRHGKKRGPLDRNIGVKIFNTKFDVIALIRPRARAFHGRFQETGLDVMRKSRSLNAVSIGRRKASHGASPFHLPRRPFLEPVAQRDVGKVAEVLGSSYDVFFEGWDRL